jgi:hypothetical protein
LAANFIGETIIFSVASAAIILEYARKRMDDAEKNAVMQQRFEKLEKDLAELRALHKSELSALPPIILEMPPSPGFLDRLLDVFKRRDNGSSDSKQNEGLK